MMKYKIVLNKDQEDDFLIFAKEESKTLDKIREILSEEQQELLGFDDERIEKLVINEQKIMLVDSEHFPLFFISEINTNISYFDNYVLVDVVVRKIHADKILKFK